MKILSGVKYYALNNAGIAIIALLLTLDIAKTLGVYNFGLYASFVAIQNIWASIAFIRFDTRIAISRNNYEVEKNIRTGFFVGLIISIILSCVSIFIMNESIYYWMVFVSGFSLAIFDVLALRFAYAKNQNLVVLMRATRVLFPLIVAWILALSSLNIDLIIGLQTVGIILLGLIYWRRWNKFAYVIKITKQRVKQHWRDLIPSLIMCMLNGVWLNGMVPFLNMVVSPSIAGQFALLQRILSGSLGLIGSATAMIFISKEYSIFNAKKIKKIFLYNMVISLIICILLSVPILGGYFSSMLGAEWIYEKDFYILMSVFYALSSTVGAVSILAVRLKDEWFLTFWQISTILLCAGVLYFLTDIFAIKYSLIVGCLMYALLVTRWILKSRTIVDATH